jgi:glycosyltransferase involved in cell wall biosynthesis
MIAPTPFFADRGCHVRILGEIRALQQAGCRITLCTYHNGRDVAGVQTIRIPRIPWYTKLEAGPSNHKYYLDLLLLWRSLATALRKRPDVIHAHLHEGAFIGRYVRAVTKRPLIFDYQGSLTDELASHRYAARDGAVLRTLGALERWIDRGADCVVASSTHAGEALRDRLGNSRVRTVLDGVDTSVFRPIPKAEAAAVRRKYGFPEEAVLAVFVGVLTAYQGIDLMLDHAARALSLAPELHIGIVGFPEEEYRRRTSELGLADRITFTGKVPFEETPDLTAAADIAVTPKTSVSEGNLKLYNYLGVFAPLGEGAAFAEGLALLAQDPGRRAKLGERSRAHAVERLSWRRAARELIDAYEAVGAVPTARDGDGSAVRAAA